MWATLKSLQFESLGWVWNGHDRHLICVNSSGQPGSSPCCGHFCDTASVLSLQGGVYIVELLPCVGIA